MQCATLSACIECARWLIETRGVLSQQNTDRNLWTPLHHILDHFPEFSEKQRRIWEPIVRMFCIPGKCDQRNRVGDTPLCQTIFMGHIPFTKLLLDCGAQLSNVNCEEINKKYQKMPKWAKDLATGRKKCHQAVITFVGIRRFGRARVMQNNMRDIITIIAKTLWNTRFYEQWAPEPAKDKPAKDKRRKSSKKR